MEIISSLDTALMYLVPGYLLSYSFTAKVGLRQAKPSEMILPSLVISFVIVAATNAVISLIDHVSGLDLKWVFGSSVHLLMLAAIGFLLGLCSAWLISTKWAEKFYDRFMPYSAGSDDLYHRHLFLMSQNEWLRIHLKDGRRLYCILIEAVTRDLDAPRVIYVGSINWIDPKTGKSIQDTSSKTGLLLELDNISSIEILAEPSTTIPKRQKRKKQ